MHIDCRISRILPLIPENGKMVKIRVVTVKGDTNYMNISAEELKRIVKALEDK